MAVQTHQGKVAVVTGAARGLGRAMALALLRAGARVVAVDLERSAFDSLLEQARRDDSEPSLLLCPADITRDESADAIIGTALARFGRLDILVNNAGLNLESMFGPGSELPEKFWDVAPADFRRILDVNAVAPFLLTRAAVGTMIEQHWGRIINVTTSLDTMFRQGMLPYGGSKAAAEAHSAAMAADLADTGVTVNVLVPGGMVKTRMTAITAAKFHSPLLEPEVMVDPLLWLTSADADGLTGRRLIAALWNSTLPAIQSLEKCSAPIAWPQLGRQAIYPT